VGGSGSLSARIEREVLCSITVQSVLYIKVHKT